MDEARRENLKRALTSRLTSISSRDTVGDGLDSLRADVGVLAQGVYAKLVEEKRTGAIKSVSSLEEAYDLLFETSRILNRTISGE